MDLRISDHAIDVVTALQFKGVGRAWIANNLDRPRDSGEIVRLLNSKSGQDVSKGEFAEVRCRVRDAAEVALAGVADGLVVCGDEGFPPLRGEVPAGDRPVAIAYRGDLSLVGPEGTTVAVIGLRQPDRGTLADETMIVEEFVSRQFVIVSGLALGCDAQAHRTALGTHGKTVAVLPSTLRRILPREHEQLAGEIVAAGGLLLTEYWTEASGLEQRNRYIERDRLQALFSDLVVLAASYSSDGVRSHDAGARHAMAAAKRYGIPRAVLPDRSASGRAPTYDLNRELLAADASVRALDPAVARALDISSQIRGERPVPASGSGIALFDSW